MSKLFISHSSQDDAFVRELQQALGYLKQDVWIDSRELIGGELLWPEIQKAIEDASAYAVVVSTDSLQSKSVGRELGHALKVQKQRGREKYPVIPLSLNGTKLGVLEAFFDGEPIYIPVSSQAGGIDSALNAILVALGKRLPADVPARAQPQDEPLEELVLELTDLKFKEQDGVRRASARARLVYEPATPGQPEVSSVQSWRFVAPLGPIEAEELRWYLEKYVNWPGEYFRDRARKVEQSLVEWGRELYEAALPKAHTDNVLQAWARVDANADRRFSVHVDSATEAGTPADEVASGRESATLLLGLPWELLHNGDGFLFQGARPTRVRRRLPNTKVLDVPVVDLPIRILLVTARPEDDVCGYIDHRASALPLVDAMETLGGLVRINVLSPPTLTALREKLDSARLEGKAYHVVHFDGHGVYDRSAGLGGLCFEDPQDTDKLDERRHQIVTTEELGPLLRDHRIPLFFLEACQSATADKASESVASELLKAGVASVVAMSHSVLVETSRRFVQAFYDSLARGGRVGDAMLEGQLKLKEDTFRESIFGVGELRLEDWFVPVLFQEKDDPQLFRATPSRQTQDDLKTALIARLGELPAAPETGFIGRSRELLALQRLLRRERFAVVRGQAGEGKTALAAEFARWMVRSQQIRRAVFVSVETHPNVDAVLDVIGRQLVPSYSVVTFDNLDQAILPVERVLAEQPTLLVVDNMESILLPPYVNRPEALSEESRHELDSILQLCAKLNAKGETRLVFTSREALPAPFDAEGHRRELQQLEREDAVKLVERALNHAADGAGAAADASPEALEDLVDAVHCHARTLALLAPALRSRGVESTRASLVELMVEMDRKFPGSREKSVFASVELSLRRMSDANRKRARALCVFHGGFRLQVLMLMMNWGGTDVVSLAGELVNVGLATRTVYDHLTLNPALCPYLRGETAGAEYEALKPRWNVAMLSYVNFLTEQQNQDAEMAARLTLLELSNLFALLDEIQRSRDVEATIALASSLYSLLKGLGKPLLVERVGLVRDAAAATLGETWNHARFDAQRSRVDQHLAGKRLQEAFDEGRRLLEQARAVSDAAYPGADYDLAVACALYAGVLNAVGGSEQALPLWDEAQYRLEIVAKERPSDVIEAMLSVCWSGRGASLLALARLEGAAAAYEESMRRGEKRGDERQIAVAQLQLGTVRKNQRRYSEALAAYYQALARFTELKEPESIAVAWGQIGMVYQEARRFEEAEDAYREALSIMVQLKDISGQARTLIQLGVLYDINLGRPDEGAVFSRQAADKYVELTDLANEGKARNNLADTLRRLGRFDEARQEAHRALKCKKQFGHVAGPWMTWAILSDIETDAGNTAAAAEAKREAVESYLAYRRVGGENHLEEGRIGRALTELLLAGDTSTAASGLQQLAADPKGASRLPFIQALQAIVTGSRDRALANAPGLEFTMAAEILFLIEKLEKPR